MRIVGCTLVADALTLEFPVLEAIGSVLPLCDQLIVNVGPSSDGTLDRIQQLSDPRIRIIQGEWNRGLGSAMLAVETQRALDLARGDWAIYIQADEILHEDGLVPFRDALERADADPRIEGLLVDFVHFYGTTDWVGTSRRWYRREVRAVRVAAGLKSRGDAQGFRAADGRRVRARASGARYFHYGWARPLEALRRKQVVDDQLYHAGAGRRAPIREQLPADVGLRPFRGTHPAIMDRWIAEHRPRMTPGFTPRSWDARRLSLLATLAVERLTGWRPFEYRNYVEV
ncbi:MAG TPA: glycosyltransferase [Gemmatimonadales bacterium]|nr:glycosyltransferase [Gemmatimonadales bacterium]